MVSLSPTRSWYTIVHVVPLMFASMPVAAGSSSSLWLVVKAALKASPGLLFLSSLPRNSFTTFWRTKLETSWPRGPWPSKTLYKAKVLSTTITEKLSWLGDSGFLPFLHAQPMPLDWTHAVTSSFDRGSDAMTSVSFSAKLSRLFRSASVREQIMAARFFSALALSKMAVRPADSTLAGRSSSPVEPMPDPLAAPHVDTESRRLSGAIVAILDRGEDDAPRVH
mmetsp:Transcript_73907/g.165450  ORF Transcript_73907/g.165450 Transcript_73907/m.165450 type:complete len:223 (+) Transcript_73907:801-1469(+)